MPKQTVQVELSPAQEIVLMARYGRKCSRETLVKRAITEVLRQQAEDVPVFVTREEATARAQAEEAARLAAEREANKILPETQALLERFRAGEKLVDLAGREVSDLQPTLAAHDSSYPLMAQFYGDNSEWYPVNLNEIVTAPVVPAAETPDA